MNDKPSESKRNFKLKWLVLGVLAIILLLIAVKLWRIGTIARSLYGAYTQVQAIAADPGSLDIMQVQPLVHQSHLDLAALQEELRPFDGLMRRLNWLPKIGGDVAAAPDLLAIGVSMSEVGDIAATAFEPVLPLVADRENLSGGSEEIVSAAVATMAASTGDFERAQQSFEELITHRAKIDADTLSPQLAKWVNRLDQVSPFLRLALEFAPVAPDLLGADEPRTYLIVAQNNDELRATGGFLTSVGTLTIEQGQVMTITFEDSYAIDDFSQPYPEPPPQLKRYMSAPIWVFRDANWSPDFSTSAQAMLDLYHISRDMKIDGVIAVDLLALQQIVEVLEPVRISGWDEAATGENVIGLIRQQWSPDQAFEGWNREWFEGRKSFVGDLVAAMRQRIEKSPGSVDWPTLSQAIINILDQRSVQIWLADETAQAIIEEQGWAGVISPLTSDYLMVIDSNLGFNKVNAVVTSSLIYQIQLTEEGGASAVLTVMHKNNSGLDLPCSQTPRSGIGGADYWEMIDRCYWNYMRIYTPVGSQLLKAAPRAIDAEYLISGRDEPARVVELPPEAGKSVWGTLMLLPHGQTLETSFHYTLPPSISEKTDGGRRYHLLLQKQAGTAGNRAQVIVHLPQGSQLVRAFPSPDRIGDDGRLEFDLSLVRDQEIEVFFE